MSVIKVTVDDQNLYITESPKIAAQGVNENYIKFEFSEDWDGFGKTAVFYSETGAGTIYTSVVNADGRALVPSAVTASAGTIHLGLSGTDGDVIKTTEILSYKVVDGIYSAESPAPEPDPGVYEQMLAMVGEIQSAQATFETEMQAGQTAFETEVEAGQDAYEAVIDARIDNFIDSSNPSSVTTLWTGSIFRSGQSATLSESVSRFDFLDFYIVSAETTKFIRVPASQASLQIQTQSLPNAADLLSVYMWETGLTISGTTVTVDKCISLTWNYQIPGTQTYNADAITGPIISRIDGVKISEESPAELRDVRVGVDGTTYASAGAAVRGQIEDITIAFTDNNDDGNIVITLGGA